MRWHPISYVGNDTDQQREMHYENAHNTLTDDLVQPRVI